MKKLLLLSLIATTACAYAQKSVKGMPKFAREDPFYKVAGLDKMWTVEVTGQEVNYISILPNESFSAPYTPGQQKDGETLIKSGIKTRSIELRCKPKSELWDDVTLVVTGSDGQAKQLFGTGQYIPDDRLNVVWILRELGGSKMTVHDFGKELPYLDLHIHDGFFTGFAGCNRIQGKLQLREDRIMELGEVSGSRMQCNANNKEAIFLAMFPRVKAYQIRNGRLYLLGDGDRVEAIFDPGTHP